jgi:hypothetical protein
MKKANQLWSMVILLSAIAATTVMNSCSKSNNNGGGNTGPTAPSNPGGYDSSNQISPSTLVAYFPFNNSYNDVKGGLTGTNNGASFTTGVKGQAYSGSGQSFVSFTNVGNLASLHSYTLSAWVNPAHQPVADNGTFSPSTGTMGIFSMYDTTGNPNLLLLEFEPYTPVSGDSVRVHPGFNNTGNTAGAGWQAIIPQAFLDTAVGKWTQIVMTYDGGSSQYTLYQNGTAIAAQSAWTTPTTLTPFTVLNGPTGGNTTGNMGAINFTTMPSGFIIGGWPYNSISNPKFGTQSWAGYLQGGLDELRIYSSALNSSDVKSLYILEKAGF